MSDVSDASYLDRMLGNAPNGRVDIRCFDVGMMQSLAAGGATLVEITDISEGPIGVYVKDIEGACPPDGYPGIPIVFANPEDTITNSKLPQIVVRRDDISPAMERWQPAGEQYVAPASGALPFSVQMPDGQIRTGFTRMEHQPQAIPYDITYTIQVKARFRGATVASPGPSNTTQRNNANALFTYVLSLFPPYGFITVVDSIGDARQYEAFTDAITTIDELVDVQDRTIGYALTVRIEAELDLVRPRKTTTVRVPLKIGMKRF